jgi:hypothetical protein
MSKRVSYKCVFTAEAQRRRVIDNQVVKTPRLCGENALIRQPPFFVIKN